MHTRSGLIQRWLLVLAIAAGLVGMHHLIAENPAGPALTVQASVSSPADPARGAGPASEAQPSSGVRSVLGTTASMVMAGSGRAEHVRADAVALIVAGVSETGDRVAGADMDMAMHACLAVLAALIALALLMGVVTMGGRWRYPGQAPPVAVGTGRARPPPRTAVRLAQLCVLRN